MSKRKFYKTVLKVVVLSEEPFEWDSLEGVATAITDGGCSGDVKEVGSVLMSGREAAKALMDQGSDPGFFRLDEDGEDVE
jgi:hypothetical protein